MRLNSDAPMNNPKSPPELAKKSAVEWNSIRLDAIRFSCLNDTVMRVNDELEKKFKTFE